MTIILPGFRVLVSSHLGSLCLCIWMVLTNHYCPRGIIYAKEMEKGLKSVCFPMIAADLVKLPSICSSLKYCGGL